MIERIRSKSVNMAIAHMPAEYVIQAYEIIRMTGATSVKIMHFDGNVNGIDTSKDVPQQLPVLERQERIEKSPTPLMLMPPDGKKKGGRATQEAAGGPAALDITQEVVYQAIKEMNEPVIESVKVGDHLKIPRGSNVRVRLSKVMTELTTAKILTRTGSGSSTTYRLKGTKALPKKAAAKKAAPKKQSKTWATKLAKASGIEPTADMVISILRDGDLYTKDISTKLGIPTDDTPTRQKVAKVLGDLLVQKRVRVVSQKGKFREFRLVKEEESVAA